MLPSPTRPVLDLGATIIGALVFLYLVLLVVAWGVVPWLVGKFRG